MSDVPDGTVTEVLDWVGEDPERAQAALDAEEDGAQRTTLMAKLEAIAADPYAQIEIDPSEDSRFVGAIHVLDDTVVTAPLDTEAAVAVDYLQVVGDSEGVVLGLNGSPFGLTPSLTAALKMALDRAIAGMSL